eukprot:4628604-Pleurochrysis_carterae.AAC.3
MATTRLVSMIAHLPKPATSASRAVSRAMARARARQPDCRLPPASRATRNALKRPHTRKHRLGPTVRSCLARVRHARKQLT